MNGTMTLQEAVEFATRMGINAGLSKEEAWDFALELVAVRS